MTIKLYGYENIMVNDFAIMTASHNPDKITSAYPINSVAICYDDVP